MSDNAEYERSELLSKLAESSGKLGLNYLCFEKESDHSRNPYIQFVIDSNTRPLVMKLIGEQVQRKNKSIILSLYVVENETKVLVTFTDDTAEQDLSFLRDLYQDIENVEEYHMPEHLSVLLDNMIKFPENKDFTPFDEDTGKMHGFACKIDSNVQQVTFHNTNSNRINYLEFPLEDSPMEYERLALRYGMPKETALMNDEEYSRAAEVWCEGNQELKKTLLRLRELGINTQGCCSGHDGSKKKRAQISLRCDSASATKFVNRLFALKLGRGEDDMGYIYNKSFDFVFLSIACLEPGYNEDYFRKLNEEIEEVVEYGERYDNRGNSFIWHYLLKDGETRTLNFDNGNNEFYEARSRRAYPINTFFDSIKGNISQADFNKHLDALFHKKITLQAVEAVAMEAVRSGLSLLSLRIIERDLKESISQEKSEGER